MKECLPMEWDRWFLSLGGAKQHIEDKWAVSPKLLVLELRISAPNPRHSASESPWVDLGIGIFIPSRDSVTPHPNP